MRAPGKRRTTGGDRPERGACLSGAQATQRRPASEGTWSGERQQRSAPRTSNSVFRPLLFFRLIGHDLRFFDRRQGMPTCDAHAAATQCTWPQARGTGAGAHACDAGGGETHRGPRRRATDAFVAFRLPTPPSSCNERALGPMAAAFLPPRPPEERCDTNVAASGPANDTWNVAPGGK